MRCRPRRSNASGSGSYWIHRAAFRHRGGAAAPRTSVPPSEAPLAVRMRPRSLDELVGQEHLLGRGVAAAGRRSRRASRTRRSSTARPGSGKTTLARIIAAAARGAFEEESAVNAGRAEVRAVIERAEERRRASGQPTIFFLDEIHRFNKAQQDALLPAVEEGLVTLIGATTENPYFEVNSALLSRAQIYELRPLGPRTIAPSCWSARSPTPSAASPTRPRSTTTALELLAARSGGDARTALVGARAGGRDGPRRRPRRSTSSVAEDALQRKARHLRPGGRPPLRLHLGLDQGDPRLRPRRLALLPGGDARGRRGPALHRPADGDLRLRGHRQRRPAGAGGRDAAAAGGGPGRAARVRAQPRPGRHLPGARPEVERLRPRRSSARRAHVREHGAQAAAALPARRPLPGRQEARARGRLRLPARRARTASPTSR